MELLAYYTTKASLNGEQSAVIVEKLKKLFEVHGLCTLFRKELTSIKRFQGLADEQKERLEQLCTRRLFAFSQCTVLHDLSYLKPTDKYQSIISAFSLIRKETEEGTTASRRTISENSESIRVLLVAIAVIERNLF